MTVSVSPPRPGRRPALRTWLLALTAATIGLLYLVAAQPASASTRSDRAATDAYLHARLRFLQSVEGNSAAAQASVKALVAKVAGECPQVLAEAPEPGGGPIASPSHGQVLEQKGELETELLVGLLRAWLSPDRQATQAFLTDTRPLHWSSTRLTRRVRAEDASAAREFLASLPDICADAKGWVASGYTRLTPGTTELEQSSDGGGSEAELEPVEPLLAPYETPAAKALLRSSARLKAQIGIDLKIVVASVPALEATLGLKTGQASGAAPIGKGRTVAGGSFTVGVEPITEPTAGEQCALPIAIEEGDLQRSACIEPAKVNVPEISCRQGLLSITLVTPASVASVSLLLDDGRQIASPVIPIPAKLGGPLGYYRQVVRGPSPIPVSLTELDGEGKPLAAVKLRRLVGCTKHPVKLVAGGAVAHGSLPHGPSYTIVVGRYRYLGQVQKKVSISFGGGRHGSAGAGFSLPGTPTASLNYVAVCSRHPTTVFVAVLPSSKDTVFARTAAGLVQLHEAAIASSVHAGAKVAYEAFATLPGELIVRDASGRTIMKRTISRHLNRCVPGSSSVAVGNLG